MAITIKYKIIKAETIKSSKISYLQGRIINYKIVSTYNHILIRKISNILIKNNKILSVTNNSDKSHRNRRISKSK